MIKIAIDPDVITYLCSIILPKQMIDSNLSRKNQIFEEPSAAPVVGLQYKIMSDEEESGAPGNNFIEGKFEDS